MPPATERIFGYAVAVACMAVGGALLTGLYRPAAPGRLGVAFGAILLLLGINRYLVTRWKSRAPRRRSYRDE
jgi:hypothetical protein